MSTAVVPLPSAAVMLQRSEQRSEAATLGEAHHPVERSLGGKACVDALQSLVDTVVCPEPAIVLRRIPPLAGPALGIARRRSVGIRALTRGAQPRRLEVSELRDTPKCSVQRALCGNQGGV